MTGEVGESVMFHERHDDRVSGQPAPDRGSWTIPRPKVGSQCEVLGPRRSAVQAHDPIRLQERTLQAADRNAHSLAVLPGKRLRGFEDAVFVDGFDGNGHELRSDKE